uniref:RNPS1 n=1 Tax=Panagrellus redivivus TaxID=6233 RepID=A0A7E4V3D1_PANRE
MPDTMAEMDISPSTPPLVETPTHDRDSKENGHNSDKEKSPVRDHDRSRSSDKRRSPRTPDSGSDRRDRDRERERSRRRRSRSSERRTG